MTKSSILVTGCSGFVGSALVRHLMSDGHFLVRGTSRSSTQNLPSGMEFIRADLSEDADLKSILQGIEVIVHTAGRAHVMEEKSSDPYAEYQRANVEFTSRLATAAASMGVKRFIFLSTIKVNGESTGPGEAFRADQVPVPKDDYALSKYRAEVELFNIAKRTGLEVIVLRIPLVYGPGVKGNFATMVRLMRKGVPLPLGAIDNRRSLVGLENLAHFVALCADRLRTGNATNKVLLVSDGEDVSTTELLNRVSLAYGKSPRLIPVPAHIIGFVAKLIGKQAAADRLLNSLVIDSSTARDLIGWTPVVSMKRQLELMAIHDTAA